MGYHLSKQNGFIEHNVHNINMVMHDGKRVFSQGFDRESSGADSVTCEGTIGKDLIDWSIIGDIVQDGIPDVDNPVDIKLVGDKTDNLLDHENIEIGWAYTDNITRSTLNSLPIGTYTLNAEFMLLSRENVDDNSSCGFIIPNVVSNRPTWNKSDVGTIKTISATIVINSGNVGKIGNVYVYGCGNDTQGKTGTTKVSKIMLNKGSTSLPYEPWGYRINMTSNGSCLYSSQELYDIFNNQLKNPQSDPDKLFVKWVCSENPTTMLMDNFKPNTQYTFQFYGKCENASSNTTNIIIVYDDNSKDRLHFEKAGEFSYSVLTSAPDKSIKRVETIWDTIGTSIYLSQSSICEGTKIIPYREPISTPIYLKTPLAKDEVLNSKGKREVEWRKLVLTGDETDIRQGDWGCYKAINTGGVSVGRCVCSHMSFNDGVPTDKLTILNVPNVIRFLQNGLLLNDFKSFLKSEYDKGTPVTVYYPLAVPTTETVDIPQIPTFRNEEKTILGTTTIITTDTEVKPSQIDASYKSNSIEYVTLTDDIGNVTKMRKSDYDDLKTNEFLDILEVM